MTESESVHLEAMEPILERHAPGGRSNLLPTLFEAQHVYGYLPAPVIHSALQS